MGNKAVVVVEDDESIREALTLILQMEGYNVTQYTDGLKLINNFEIIPDIYLIDRLLSGIDGLDLCKHIKNNDKTAHVPVIILSATPGLENMSRNAGASGFIEKPFTKKLLMFTIQDTLMQAKKVN